MSCARRNRRPADPYVVQMILMGMPGGTRADNLAAMRQMPPGLTARQLAGKLGVTIRTVQRYRAELRKAS